MMLEQRSGTIRNNGFGLYTVKITGENGEVIVEAQNLPFDKAVGMFEDYMHTRRRDG